MCLIGLDRFDLATQRDRAVDLVGFLSQSGGIYTGLSALDHLRLAAALHDGFDTGLARAVLDELGTPTGRRAGSLSGGQQKHIELAVALGTRAPVLLLDEPMNALDALARTEFLRVLARVIRSSGRTAVLTSHIVRDIELVCDRIAVLGGGRIRLHTTVADALASHRIAEVPAGAATDPVADGVVGRFRRLDGGSCVVSRSDDPGLPVPTLEELVMAHLASDGGTAT